MRARPWVAPLPAGGTPEVSLAYDVEWADEMACVAKHLVVAASQLTRDDGLKPEEVVRLARAEAHFRALASACEGVLAVETRPIPPTPAVRIDAETYVPLALLLAGVYERTRWWVTSCSIDAELVAGAKELLRGLKWDLPDDAGAPAA